MNVSPPYSLATLFVAKMWPILGPLHDLTCYYLPLVVASNEGCGSLLDMCSREALQIRGLQRKHQNGELIRNGRKVCIKVVIMVCSLLMFSHCY